MATWAAVLPHQWIGTEFLSASRYVVEVDGVAKTEYRTFITALKAGLQFKQAFSTSTVKLRDADKNSVPIH
jgi:hypothetical protein